MARRSCIKINCCFTPIANEDITLRGLVEVYVKKCRGAAKGQLKFFAKQSSLAATIEVAALCIINGKRSSHHRRRSKATLIEARNVLMKELSKLKQSRSFQELHETVDRTVRHIPYLGELYSYDTALHIGAKLKQEPIDEVYLHSGTRVGARNLGLDYRHPTISLTSLRPELRVLSAREIEDFLCIFKDHLHEGMA